MTATEALTEDLKKQVIALEDDLRRRVDEDLELHEDWQRVHRQATVKERTAWSWTQWRDDRVTQTAVAWALMSVFIRFCEDNALVKPVWITGPGRRRQEALDAELAFFREHGTWTEREWLEDAIAYLGKLPATKALVDTHSALRYASPSGEAIEELIKFWRNRSDDGKLVHDLRDETLSTRFLGDLYQNLSAYAQETYALFQTPDFVEEHILDQTLEPALKERPLEGFRMIDPTCGSGHFLLGAFNRFLDRWHKHAPAMEIQARVQSALDAIHGVDLNPFAVAIARFRLTVVALQACGLQSLEDAPAFRYHLAVGDSLIHGPDSNVLPGLEERGAFLQFHYGAEDAQLLLELLEEGRYDVVVGNPPYITVKDKALNKIYRSKFADVCKGKYALTVPFMAQFFALAKRGEQSGWVGQITSNSFMKREFGAPLIEVFLSHRDLRVVEDTSGAYIPNHGTPTVIIVGRNHAPVGSKIRAALGVRGEPTQPDVPSEGKVWQSISGHIDGPPWENRWITIADIDRNLLSTHPWSLAGGGAIELLQKIESDCMALGREADSIGITAFTLEDEVYVAERSAFTTRGIKNQIREMVLGEGVRDWVSSGHPLAIFPYDEEYRPIRIDGNGPLHKWMWPYRTNLSNNILFGGQTKVQAGMQWTEYGRLTASKLRTPLSITFAAVATHNHFALERGGRVFKQSALVVKLPKETAEDEHLRILGILNSSIACFWLKQKSYAKTGTDNTSGGGNRWSPEPWYSFYDFNGTTLQDYPLPKRFPIELARMLDELSKEAATLDPSVVCSNATPTANSLAQARQRFDDVRMHMVALQEELDWQAYAAYGIIDWEFTYSAPDLPRMLPGQRAFEIFLERAVCAGEESTSWFTHHGHKPITEIPQRWPSDYKKLISRRLDLMADNRFIRLLEQPEYKRRWSLDAWEIRVEKALRGWLLDRLEDRRFWFDTGGGAEPKSVGQLADEVTRDADIVSVLALWEGRPDVPVTQSLERLLADETVPFLAAYRYKDSGLRKRQAWEKTWELQRREDHGEKVDTIQVPPKYTSADFRKPSYWRARSKLDVPKERFTLYPDANRQGDPTTLLGWAGWDHAEQSLALSRIIGEREQEGWDDERLVPLVAGLAELEPWVKQWHSEVDERYGVSLAAFCQEQLDQRAAQVGKTSAELAAWRPAPSGRGRKPRAKGGAE